MTTLLAYESVPRNAALLARLGDVKLREVRSLMQLKQATEQDVVEVVAIEVTAPQNLPTVSQLIRTLKRDRRCLAVIAMPIVGLPGQNSSLIQAGTDLVFETALDRDSVRRLLRKVVNRCQDLQTPQKLSSPSFRSRLFDTLPWKRFSS